MLSEGIHSIVDTGNGILVLHGLRRAAVHPDHEHPLGYSREIYFWSFVVAVLLFAIGAGISLYSRRPADSEARARSARSR
jgi:divalent metal cation (Fe/Co/Zn/Cd) transporter